MSIRRMSSAFAAALLLFCMADAGGVQMWLTTADGSRKLARQADISFAKPHAKTVFDVDAAQRYQRIAGFGAAMTDASAYLIRHRLNEGARNALLSELFEPKTGIGFSVVRIPVGASDFSLSHYTYDDMPVGERDPLLHRFSLSPAETDALPLLRQVQILNSNLKIVAAPWSAPAWMKTNGNLIQGALRTDAFEVYAAYLDRYLSAMRQAGAPVWALSVQNEPDFEPKDYPGMRVSAQDRARLIGDHLGPLMAKNHPDTRILEWDHNWDKPEQPSAVLADTHANRYISSVAWHCYNGDVSAMAGVHDVHPDKETYLTECSGGEWAADWGGNLIWMSRNLVIDALRYWASGVTLWNLALDENHGPHTGGCEDCRGVVTIDSRTGIVTRNIEYYVLAHASRFVHPGAIRVESGAPQAGLDQVAFLNPDGSFAMIVLNSGSASQGFAVRQGPRSFSVTLPGGALASFVWR